MTNEPTDADLILYSLRVFAPDTASPGPPPHDVPARSTRHAVALFFAELQAEGGYFYDVGAKSSFLPLGAIKRIDVEPKRVPPAAKTAAQIAREQALIRDELESSLTE